MSKIFCLCFLQGVLWYSGFIFRWLIYFEFTFVYGVRKCPTFIFLHRAVQFSQHQLLKKLSFPIVYACLLCCKLIDHKCVDLFLGFLIWPIDLCFYFCTSTLTLTPIHACTPMFIATLLTIAEMQNQPKCLATNALIKKVWYIHT